VVRLAVGTLPAVLPLEFNVLDMANAAQLGRWEEPVYLDERSPIPCAFVFQHANEIAEYGIRNYPSKAAILEHVLAAQSFRSHFQETKVRSTSFLLPEALQPRWGT